MKKIFLLGNIKSSYIIQFIENVLEPLGLEVYMQVSNDDIEFAKKMFLCPKIHFIRFYDSNESKMFRIPFLGSKIQKFYNYFELVKNKPFDYVHVQYVHKHYLSKALFVKSKRTKCFASFWGSDLLRQSESVLREEEKFLKKFDFISTAALLLQSSFEQCYPNLKRKSEMIPFGCSLLPYIEKYSNDINTCKKFFNFPQNKKVVAIGYNASEAQQHDKVLAVLDSIKNKNDFFLVFQMSYGSKEEIYYSNLFKMINESGFEYKIITDFLSMDNLAKLRIATDVFINAQTTDAFSNSVIECIYAETQIINARWLHYPELDQYPIYVNEFSDFKEIPMLLKQSISEEKLEWNKLKIKEESTWEVCRKKWATSYGVENKE
ncbi:MAG: glycosyltransferase [Treponema sp.]|nr:glycosyltransferase [Treponema sp.]